MTGQVAAEKAVQRSLAALRKAAGGQESACGHPDPRHAEEMADQARASVGAVASSPATAEAARAALALIEEGRVALREVASKGTQASITRTQAAGLEAIVRLTGRPSLLIQKGTFSGTTPDWSDTLTIARSAINQVIASVGRVDLPERGGAGYVGTAFMVAGDLAATNRHVAKTFAQPVAGGWAIRPGMTPSVDFKAEFEQPDRRSHKVVEIVGIHADPLVDLALLRLAPTSGANTSLPAALPLSTDAALLTAKRQLYVVGYPAYDDRNDDAAIDRIFGTIFMVKRLAPGEFVASRRDGRQLVHDCSTLGGNSGSCVVDMSYHRVVGLHYSGDFLEENRAVALASLPGDPLLAGKGLNFQ